jgi:hypothetical protein
MPRWLLFFILCWSLSAAEIPKIAIIGGPRLLWPEITAAYQRRYPAEQAVWLVESAAKSADVDLLFAYHPTEHQLAESLPRSAEHWLGMAIEFAAVNVNPSVDPEATAYVRVHGDRRIISAHSQ